MMQRRHDERKGSDVNEMNGQVLEKFCKYTRWQNIENTEWMRGRESKKYSKTWMLIMTFEKFQRMVTEIKDHTHINCPFPKCLCRDRMFLDQFSDV